jgi:N-methylhydantoinase A
MAERPVDAAAVAALEEAFGREYERTYGQRGGAREPIELVNLRVVVQAVSARPRLPERLALDRTAGEGGVRRAYFGPEHGWLDTPVLGRAALGSGRTGPCIVEEYDATCLVPPGSTATLDGHGNIVVDLA